MVAAAEVDPASPLHTLTVSRSHLVEGSRRGFVQKAKSQTREVRGRGMEKRRGH